MRPLHGPATIRAPPPSFLLPPTFPSTAHTARKRAAPLYRSLVPSWLSAEQDGQRPERYAESQTLHAPIQRFETPKLSSGPRSPDIESDATCEFGKEYGLLCLEREVPEDVSSALEQVADSADPFKVEVLRSHTQDDESWLDTLVSEPFSAAAVDPEIRPLRMLSQTEKSQQRQVKDNAVGEVSEATHTARRKTILPDRDSVEAPTAAHQQHQQRQQVSSVTDKAVRWLKMDVKRVANIFVQEITSLNQGVHAVGATVAAAPAFPAAARAGGDGGDAVDVTVKLELLKKGKCPRFHLDKVKMKLIGLEIVRFHARSDFNYYVFNW